MEPMRTETKDLYRTTSAEAAQEATVLARALELAAEASHCPVPAEEARRAAAFHALDSADWTTVAAFTARALGLAPHLRGGTPARGRYDRPALVRCGPGEWLLALDTKGSRVRVVRLDDRGETRMTMTARELTEAARGGPWLHLQPLLALDPISQRRVPHLARHPWRRLRAFLGLESRELGVVLIYAVVVGGLTLATPIAVQALVNSVALGAVVQPLVILTILLLAGLSFSALLSVLEAYVVEVLQRRIYVRVADDFGRRLATLDAEVHDEDHGPELVNRFFDVVIIQKSLSILLVDGLALALQMLMGMVLLAFYHPFLLAFDVILIVLLVAVLMTGRGAVRTGLKESTAKFKTAAWLEDLARRNHGFRGAAGQREASERTESLCRDYLAARKSHFRILVRQIAGGLGLQVVAMVALLGIGGWLVMQRQLTLGQLVAAELVLAAMGAGFAKLGQHLEKLYDLAVAVVKVSDVVDLPTLRRGGEPLSGIGPATLILRDVAVERGDRAVLEGVHLEVSGGETVLLEGPAGAGKSTLLDAIGGARRTSHGSVQIDGLDLRRADLASVQERVVLLRRPEFFAGSVLDNLTAGSPIRCGEPELRGLLRRVGLEEAVDGLPHGLDTPMLPTGAPLSESHGRRLAVVRALAAQPRMLLIDRGLDGLRLDPPTKAALLDFVLGPDAPWTAIVVTDEPDIAARCSTRARIDQGSLEVAS